MIYREAPPKAVGRKGPPQRGIAEVFAAWEHRPLDEGWVQANPDGAAVWYWRLRRNNGQITQVGGESYTKRHDAIRAADSALAVRFVPGLLHDYRMAVLPYKLKVYARDNVTVEHVWTIR